MSTIDNPERVKSFFRRMDDIDARKTELAQETKDLKAEFKGENFDVPALIDAWKLSKADPADQSERDFVIQAYLEASKK